MIDYRNIVRESIFTLAPWGNNPESLRLYEALEVGSIPIFHRISNETSPMTPMGSNNNNNPIPQFNSWDDAIDFIHSMHSNQTALDELQDSVLKFYHDYKEKMQLNIKAIIDKAFRESHGFEC